MAAELQEARGALTQVLAAATKGLKGKKISQEMRGSIHGGTQKWRSMMEKPIEIEDLGVPPISGNHQMEHKQR